MNKETSVIVLVVAVIAVVIIIASLWLIFRDNKCDDCTLCIRKTVCADRPERINLFDVGADEIITSMAVMPDRR